MTVTGNKTGTVSNQLLLLSQLPLVMLLHVVVAVAAAVVYENEMSTHAFEKNKTQLVVTAAVSQPTKTAAG